MSYVYFLTAWLSFAKKGHVDNCTWKTGIYSKKKPVYVFCNKKKKKPFNYFTYMVFYHTAYSETENVFFKSEKGIYLWQIQLHFVSSNYSGIKTIKWALSSKHLQFVIILYTIFYKPLLL